jgi:hypothetical protein
MQGGLSEFLSQKPNPPKDRRIICTGPASSLEKGRREKDFPSLQTYNPFPSLYLNSPQRIGLNILNRKGDRPRRDSIWEKCNILFFSGVFEPEGTIRLFFAGSGIGVRRTKGFELREKGIASSFSGKGELKASSTHQISASD